jgi:hypothetical protein
LDTKFAIRLEGPCQEAAFLFLTAIDRREGVGCITQRGKDKQREEYEPIVEQHKERLIDLLNINFAEFAGRFHNVFKQRHYREENEFYVNIERLEGA